MSKIISAKAVISASDATGTVFDAIARKIKGVGQAAKGLESIKAPKFTGNFAAELERLKATEREMQKIRASRAAFETALKSGGPMKASRYFEAMDIWKANTIAALRAVKAKYGEVDHAQNRFFQRAGRNMMTAVGIGSGAYVAGRVGRAGITAAATSQRESARDYLSGMPQSESDQIAKEAMKQSAAYPSVDASTMHERLRDTSMGMRSTDKAVELGETIAQGTTVLQSLKGKDKAIEEGRKFFSALDVLGKNIDPKEVRELFNGYIKALGVEGADMDLGGVLQMARQSRAAGGILSNRFLMTTAPGLGRDLGDSQLGTSLASALSQNIGGRATKTSKAAQQEYGLRDKQGNFLDSKLAMTDPDKFAWERLMPAMQKKGVDINDNVAVTKTLAGLFSNRTVQDVFSKLITQREQYQAKAGQYEKAPGLEGAKPLLTKDPFVGWEAVLAQLRNLATQAPLMDAAASGLAKLSTAIGSAVQTFSEGNKAEKIGATTGVGILGGAAAYGGLMGVRGIYQWFTGGAGALTASAAALDASAVALTAAAARIAVASAAGAAGAAAAGSGAAAAGGGAAAGAGGGALWGAGAAALPWLGGAAVAGASMATLRAAVDSAGYAGMTSGERMRKQRGGSSVREMLRRDWTGGSSGGSLSDTGDGPGGDSRPVTAKLEGSAEVSGETTVKVEVTVNPSSELINATASAKASAAQMKGILSANGPGSTGRSSPDAAAPALRGNTGAGGDW